MTILRYQIAFPRPRRLLIFILSSFFLLKVLVLSFMSLIFYRKQTGLLLDGFPLCKLFYGKLPFSVFLKHVILMNLVTFSFVKTCHLSLHVYVEFLTYSGGTVNVITLFLILSYPFFSIQISKI